MHPESALLLLVIIYYSGGFVKGFFHPSEDFYALQKPGALPGRIIDISVIMLYNVHRQ